jgi:ATPase subunit of ABC transporter with duplicated ATPase domains
MERLEAQKVESYDIHEMVDPKSSHTVTLEWNQIAFSANEKPVAGKSEDSTKAVTSEKIILQGLHGKASPKEILAVMGTSGAGKRELLRIFWICRHHFNFALLSR